MASVLKVDKLDPQSGTALEIGTSGDTVSIPSGATLDISASTLTPPATMPASSGVNLTALNASNLGSGTVPAARLSGVGIVLQVVNAKSTVTSTTSSVSFVDITDLTVNITPSATSSKVFVIMHVAGITSAASALSGVTMRIYQGADISGEAVNIGYGDTAPLNQNASLQALDSPSSTSELTYKGQFRNREAQNVTVGNSTGETCTITVMEIAG